MQNHVTVCRYITRSLGTSHCREFLTSCVVVLSVYSLSLDQADALFAQGERTSSNTTAVAVSNPDAAGAAGGGAQADFDTLIDLIQTTIAPDSWEDVGGEGSIMGYPGGVYVDASGVLRELAAPVEGRLETLWKNTAAVMRDRQHQQDLSAESRLRKVSLLGLLAAWTELQRDNLTIPDEMRLLAGMRRVDYIWIDDAVGDVVLAGPAGAWTVQSQGRIVGVRDHRPLLRLDDLMVLLRNVSQGPGEFLCAITPTQANLQRTQAFLNSQRRPVAVGQRDAWIQRLRDEMGFQEIEVQGIDAGSRVARVIVEADYHMKLIGIGLVPGVEGLESYLDSVQLDADGRPPEMGVLRWWFALDEACVSHDAEGQLYELSDRVVRLLSENELLTARGERVHTGKSEPANRQFARDFTEHFDELADRYPVYAELENVFRMAIAAAVISRAQRESIADNAFDAWLTRGGYELSTSRAPRQVASVVNLRELNERTFVAAVSGGVSFQRAAMASQLGRSHGAPKISLATFRRTTSDGSADRANRWWWD